MTKYRFSIFLVLLVALVFFPGRQASAALSLVKDTISTSRPSAAAPLYTDINVTNGRGFAEIYDNGSRFIASDSAKLLGQTFETVIVASQGAQYTSPARRKVYFATPASNDHYSGTVIMTPVTAKHTVSFSSTAIPNGGHVILTFPVGDTSNPASPSATGFSFNNLAAGNISVTGISVSSCAPTAATGTIDCTLNSAFAGGAASIVVGVAPTLVNPTKSSASGTADTWTLVMKVTDGSSVTLDQIKIKIGTIDSVEVYAQVDPTFSFSIAPVNNGSAVNTSNTTGCLQTEVTNTGINPSADVVNMGVLDPSKISIAAQYLTVTTNGAGGYTLTATTSGHLIDPETGYWINDAQNTPTADNTPVPVGITAGTTAFGIHACGLDVTTATWGTNNCTTVGGGCKYANPSPTYLYLLATDNTGPISTIIAAGNGITSVSYASTISAIVPAGNYRTAVTYVATPVF